MLAPLKRQRANLSTNIVLQGLLLACVGLTLVFVLNNLWLSRNWINRPFAGFLHRHHVITGSNLPHWPAWQENIAPGDMVLSVDDQTLSGQGWLDYLRQQGPGRQITYNLHKMDGSEVTVLLPARRFSNQDFIQLVGLPVFIAALTLATTAALIYLRPQSGSVKLFGLYTLATVYSLASLPDFTTGNWFYVNFIGSLAGRILMPPLLLHFLLQFPYEKQILRRWEFLLPLIYLPVLPMLIYLPVLINSPAMIFSFEFALNFYFGLYAAGGIVLLLKTYQASRSLERKQAVALLIAFILPLSLMLHNVLIPILNVYGSLIAIHETLGRYIYWAIPISILFVIFRYHVFGLSRISYQQVFYLGTISTVLAICLVLLSLTSPINVGYSRLAAKDLSVILSTIITFLAVRLIYGSARHWWANRNLSYSLNDLKINLRILSRELLKVRSHRELGALVSWNIPTDFSLQSAELSTTNVPSIPYALQLPLNINKVSLGTLYLGPKPNGKVFTAREQTIFTEVQKQISLALLSLELDRAVQTTEELTRLKSKFLANVTHELRTPLNGIINYIGFVLDDGGSLNEEQVIYLKQALRGAERLLELINNILDMSKIEAGHMTLLTRPVSLPQLVSEVVPLVDELLYDKPVILTTDIAPDLPAIQGDRLRLRQIMLNLLSNAVKFTERGVIHLGLYAKNGSVIMKVADTGCGIMPEILPKIFQGFTSTELTDANQVSGPGLGLPITKTLVELHHGHIEVSSQVGRGTTFIINLPTESSTY